MTAADTITVLRARGRRLAKLVRPSGLIEDYDQVRTVDLFDRQLEGLAELAGLLRALEDRPDCCIVRGAILDRHRVRGVRRLRYDDPETGDKATLHEVPHCWAALDIDKLERPAEVAADDVAGAGEVAIAALPAPFRSAAAIVQATASAGFKPGLRLRLWFWLARPVDGAELKYWLRAAPVDPACFRPAQVIYTAAPMFEAGAADPLAGGRTVQRSGAELVPVPAPHQLKPPPPPPPKPLPRRDDTRAASFAFAALTTAAARIARAGEGQRHPTLMVEACRLARLIDARLLSTSEVRDVLTGAARAAGLDGAGRNAAAETERALGWALNHNR
jgi:hypothetical protein